MARLIVFTGSGISAESGVPTFRGDDGLWEDEDLNVVCDLRTWKDNFDRVHTFYNGLRTRLSEVEPNAAHHAVKAWQDRYDTVLLTQNCDDLFERAGCHDVIHLHGEMTKMRCTACGEVWDIGRTAWDQDRCPKCNSLKGVKPHVVFFGEEAPLYSKMWKTLAHIGPDDVVAVIGTSSQVIDIHSMLRPRPGFKLLNNLAPGNQYMEEMIYDHCFYMAATEAVPELEKYIVDNLEIAC